AVAVLPLASVTVQVTVVLPFGKLGGALLPTVEPGQLSAKVGAPRLTPAAAHWPASVCTVTAAGVVMVGFSWSSTVTSWVAVAVLPLASVTVQVTVVLPLGKLGGALLLTVDPGQLSAKVGLPSATPVATHRPASVLTITAAGAVMVGA